MIVYHNPSEGNVIDVKFSLPATSAVRIVITDVAGKIVYRRNLGTTPAGEVLQTLEFMSLPKGTYFIHVQSHSETQTAK